MGNFQATGYSPAKCPDGSDSIGVAANLKCASGYKIVPPRDKVVCPSDQTLFPAKNGTFCAPNSVTYKANPDKNCKGDDVNVFGVCIPKVNPTSTTTSTATTTQAAAAFSSYESQSANVAIDDKYKQELDAIKPLRPPVAPAQDIQKVKKQILDPQPSMLFLQIALFLVFLSLLGYIVLSPTYAHMVAFVLLCIGVSLGFFLKK